MASRTTTDPIEILLEMGVDLDNLSEEEDYLSALKEAIATIQFQTKGSGDERSRILQEEVIKVRKKRKAEDSKFRAKKTVISADSIRPIRSPQLRSQKIPVQKLLPGAAQDSEPEETKEKKKRTRKGKTVEVPATFITSVSKSVKSILGTLKQQSSFLKKTAEKDRKAAEREKRSVAETKLESKFFKPIIEAAQKVVAPVKGILSKIFDFFYNVFLAKVVVKIADWMSNPDNQRKVTNTIRFLTDHGPKLLLAYILFGNRLGRFVTGLAARLIFGAARLAAAGFKLIAALPWWAKVGLAGTALFGAGAVVPKVFPGTTKDAADDAADALKAERGAEAAAEEITRQNTERNFLQMFGDFITGAGAERTEQADRLTTGTEARYGFFGELQERSDPTAMFSGGGMVGFPQLGGGGGGLDALTNQAKVRTFASSLSDPTGIKARRAFFNDPNAYLSDEDFKNRGIFPEDRNRKKTGRRVRGYEQGGEVDGPGGVDKVPAMLTDGEFVMSRGAVQKYGLSTLESMNAAGGGTNKPKIVENTYYAVGGGGIGPTFAEHSSDHSHSSRTGGINPGGILGRYVYGDQSIPNLIAQGKFKEALEAINFKLDINLDGVKQLIDDAMAGLQGLSDQVMSVATEAVNQSVQLIQNVPVMAQQVYDQAMVGAAQLYDQAVVFAGQAQQFANELPAKLKEGYDSEVRRFYATTVNADRMVDAEAERYVTQAEFDKLSPEEQLDKLIIRSTNKDGVVTSTKSALTARNQERQTNTIERLKEGLNSENPFERFTAGIMNEGMIALPSQMLKNLGATEGFDKAISGLSGGRIKKASAAMSAVEMTLKGLLGPLGMPFQTDASSIIEYNKPLMDFAIENNLVNSKGEFLVGKDSWSEILGDKAYEMVKDPETGRMVRGEHLYDKMQRESMGSGAAAKIANYGLGQFAFSVDQESGKAKVTDSWDSNNSAAYYFGESEKALKNGDVYNALFKGFSGLLRVNQNSFLGYGDTGFANTLPAGVDITSRSGFEQALTSTPSAMQKKSEQVANSTAAKGYFSSTTGQFYPSYADALKDPRVKAAAQVEETKKKLSFAPTQQPNLTIPGTPVAQQPKVTITNMQENASSGGNSATSGNNPVPSISMPPASSSKTKVLGFLPEPLQFF